MISTKGAAGKNLLVVDCNAAFRELLARFIENNHGGLCVCQAQDVDSALGFVERTLPDAVVLDWALRAESPIELLAHLVKCSPRPRILILSTLCSEQLLRLVLEYGVDAVVEKSATLDEIRWAIDAVLNGRSFFSSKAADALKHLVTSPSRQGGGVNLTPRERQVLLYIAGGKRSKDIARVLNLSLSTVNNCRARIGRKSGLKSAAELTRLAYDLNLIAPVGQTI